MMSPKGKITVVIADDTLIAREGLKKILQTSQEMRVVAESVTAEGAVRDSGKLKPHVVLMDLKWYGDDTAGWTAIREIKAFIPEVRIIAITAYENLIHAARLAGADSALLKTFSREELLTEIRKQASHLIDGE